MDQMAHNAHSVRNDTPGDESERLTGLPVWKQDQESERLISEALDEHATSYRNTDPLTPTGAQPVPQVDSRVVPQWAMGTAVAGIGLGAMSIGVGAGANLMGAGADMFFSNLTTEDVVALGLIVTAPGALAAAVGIIISRLKAAASQSAEQTHNYYGATTIENRTEINQTANRWFTRNISHKH